MSRKVEGNGEETAASQGMGSPPPRREGWVRLPGERGTQLIVALVSAALMVVGGLGPWVRFGVFSAAGTEGDGWFLIGAGLVAGYLLVRLNSKEGQADRWTWLVPVAGAVGAIVGLYHVVDLLKTELVSVGWGLWIGVGASIVLVGVSVHLIRPIARQPVLAALVSVLVVAGGVGLGLAAADGEGEPGAQVSWTDDESAEPEIYDDPVVEEIEETVASDEAETAEMAEEEPAPDDCDALGINPQERREGSCVSDGQAFEVVNRGSKLRLAELNARLLDIETTKTVSSEYLDPVEASGTYVIATLDVENKMNVPQSFDPMGDHAALFLDGNIFTEDFEAANTLETSFLYDSKPIQPKSSRTGAVVFDIPNRFLPELDRAGNVAILNFSELSGFTDAYDPPEVIGVIRTG